MRTLLLALLLSFGSLSFLAGCDNLLSTEPAQSVSPEVGLADMRGVRGVALSTYSRNHAWSLYGNLLTIGPDLLADHAILRPGASRHSGLISSDVGSHMGGIWSNSYQLINDANTVLDALPGLDTADPEVTEAELTRLRGEMLFMRALTYHNLVKTFGYEPGMAPATGPGAGWDLGVVIRTEPTHGVGQADARPRSTVAEVYDVIRSDLDGAIDALEQGDRGSAFYANYPAALALRARVALYERDWPTARDYATQAIEATGVSLVSGADYAAASLADPDEPYQSSNIEVVSSIFDASPNPESLFEIAILTQRESLGVNDALSPYLLPRQWHANVPSPDLLDRFEDGDVRRLLYPFDDVEHGEPYTIKYNESNDQWTDNVPVIRLPEVYLIRAEAELELGNEGQALEDLNAIRTARGASELGNASIDAVLEERSRELAFEGHRFFDFKRRGMEIRKPDALVVRVPYNDHRVLAPIPSGVLSANPELVQNPEY